MSTPPPEATDHAEATDHTHRPESTERTERSSRFAAAGARVTRRGVLLAAGLIAVGSLCIQLSSSLASTLFTVFGPFGASSLRMLIAAVILLIAVRPSLRGRTRGEWLSVAIYGTSMAAMNMSFYGAVERLPLGVAVTLEFLGPCAVALLASRHIREGLCAIGALVGVILVAGPGGYFDLIGYLFGLGAAFFFALYTLFSSRVGKTGNGMSGLALSVTVAAIVSLPFGVPVLHLVTPHFALILVISAILGVVITFSVDTIAARVTSSRVVGTLFSIDPVLGTIVGAVVLGQGLTWTAVLGICIAVAAGAALVWMSGDSDSDDSAAAESAPADLTAQRIPPGV